MEGAGREGEEWAWCEHSTCIGHSLKKIKSVSKGIPTSHLCSQWNPAVVRNVIGFYRTNAPLLSAIAQKILTLWGKSSMKARRSWTSVWCRSSRLNPVGAAVSFTAYPQPLFSFQRAAFMSLHQFNKGCIVGLCLDFWHLHTPEVEVKFLNRTALFNSSWGLTSIFFPKQKIFAILSNPVINILTYWRQKTSWPDPVQWALLLKPYQEAYLETKSLRTLMASLVIIRCWNYTRLF